MDLQDEMQLDDNPAESAESSDSDSSEDNATNEEYNKLVDLVWQKQDKNRDSYDIQKEVLDAVLDYGDITLASYSIEIMSNCFPLAPNIWKKYMDIQKYDDIDENQISVLRDIYRKALFDYYSIELQEEYLTLSLKCDVETARLAFEEALTREGLHPLYGYRIWDNYRLFESSTLSVMKEDSPEQRAQLSRLADIILRQLSTPLQYDEDLYSMLCNLSAEVPNLIDIKSAERLKKESAKRLELYLGFEKRLDEIQEENSLQKLAIFTDYISTIQNSNDSNPKFIESLYYRATTEFCLNTDLWRQFCQFSLSQKNVDSELVNKSTIDNIIHNALRNVPWSAEIWILKLRWQEHCGLGIEEVKTTLEKALVSCSQNVSHIWMAYLEFLRRKTDFTDSTSTERLRNTFSLCVETLNMRWQELGDPTEIMKFWARLEYTILTDPAKGREIWNEVMGYGNNKTEAYLWLEMAKLEEGRGAEQARKIYRRAVLECGSLILIDAWLAFERMHGNLESLEKCIKTCDEQSHRFSEIKILKSYQETKKRRYHFDENDQSTHKRFKSDIRHKVKARSKSTNKKEVDSSNGNGEPMDCSSNKVKKVNKGKSKKIEENDIKEGSELSNLHISKEESQEKRVQHDPSKDHVTIFISNLDYAVKEDQLVAALKEKKLDITETRLVTKPNGTNKGYAYVVLKNTEEVEKALSMDRTLLSGRPMYISSCHGDKEQRKRPFKYPEQIEKNKLFIKGLPFETNVDDLKEIFCKYGELKDVRLVTYKNGKSKGLAFVEYVQENAASSAILQTDNMVLKGHTISVAISDPPPRKSKFNPSSSQQDVDSKPSLGAGTGQFHGIRKAKISFIPRSVQKAVLGSDANKDIDMSQTTEQSAQDHKSKSNDDFRKMLLGSK